METVKKLVQWIVDLETAVQRKDQIISQLQAQLKAAKETKDAKPASE